MHQEYISHTQMGTLPKFIVLLLLGFFPCLGVLLTVTAFLAFFSFIIEGVPLFFALLLFLLVIIIAVFCFAYGWALICYGLAQYRFHKDGLFVKYPLSSEQCIPWADFQEICVCYAAYTTRGTPRANTVICCVRKSEKKNSIGRWKTDNPFRYKTVMCIDYRPSLLEGIKEMCPFEIPDLRNTSAYRL